MPLFLSTYANKIDKKGRVSVPADYRAALQTQSFQGIVVIPAMGEQALDGYASDRLEAMSRALDVPGTYNDEEREEAELLFASARRLPFDGEGRVILPEECIQHTGITEQAVYAGLGPVLAPVSAGRGDAEPARAAGPRGAVHADRAGRAVGAGVAGGAAAHRRYAGRRARVG